MIHNTEKPKQQEIYMHDYDGSLTKEIIAERTADIHAAFFLPYLRSGMKLLDCGCGPGTITAGLAQATSPGHTTGIDLEESQLDVARQNAEKFGLTNVTFDTGNVYQLPYQDNVFDVVFSHAMLEHLRQPLAALKEMHRVLKPGGLLGVRSIDLAATLIAPHEVALAKAHDNWVKYRQYCGGDPFIGRRLRALLREAGFAKTIGSASSETWGTQKLTHSIRSVLISEFTGPKIAETALQMGWAERDELDKTERALSDWGENSDAFMAMTWCEAIGWK